MITTSEAATRLRLTTRRIRQLAQAGEIEAEQVETARGPVWMIDEASLDARGRRTNGREETATRGECQMNSNTKGGAS